MNDETWNWFSTGSWLVILGTVGFFLIKGLLWLALPFVLIRLHRRRKRSCDEIQDEES